MIWVTVGTSLETTEVNKCMNPDTEPSPESFQQGA